MIGIAGYMVSARKVSRSYQTRPDPAQRSPRVLPKADGR
jgi:hypothetical protein